MSNRPFILLITCDELNKNTLSVYGNQAISTPNIDKLANCGIRYDSAYTVSPWCLPARCAMLTGLYPHKSGAYSNFRKCPLDTGVPNMFKAMNEAGYKTSLFGKCHFAPVPYGMTRPNLTLPYDDFKEYYQSLGIDRLDLQDDKQVSVWFMDDWAKDAEKNGTLKSYRDAVWNGKYQKVFPFPGELSMHPDVWVADRAIGYINDSDPNENSFAWVSFSGPHYPMDSPSCYIGRVDSDKLTPMIFKEGELDSSDRIHHKSYHGGGNIDGAGQAPEHGCKNFTDDYWQRMRTNYNANVLLIDDMVGRIVDAASRKYGDNLVVLFTADHGEMLGNHKLWGKHNCAYEEVWHIPMFLYSPKYAGVPEISNALVNTCDIPKTLTSLAGGTFSTDDGQNLLEGVTRKYTFAEGEGYIAVTNGKHKYVHVQKPNERYEELLDLESDPCEFENQIEKAELSKVLAELRGKVIEHIMKKVLP